MNALPSIAKPGPSRESRDADLRASAMPGTFAHRHIEDQRLKGWLLQGRLLQGNTIA